MASTKVGFLVKGQRPSAAMDFAVFDLEAALRGLDVGDAGRAIEDFFARTAADFLSLSPGDLRQVVEMALQHNVTAAAG
jgi:hypothetical protein